ncbi:MAG: hypothetical protein C0180_04600 [Aciduliprofundum sp.]|nr:MAG: hypothetical protein C0180_04600 [Aciduliprofundum sp.]
MRELNNEIRMPRIFISNRRGENIFNIPTNLIYIIESEKITTDYDYKFHDIMNNFLFYEHYFIISDIGDEFSASASKIMGKLYGEKSTGIFIYPFSFEGGNRINNADSFLSQVGSYFPRYFIFRNDHIFRVFPNIPMRSIPRVKATIMDTLVVNLSESLDLNDIVSLGKGELGFGISTNERMDLLHESLKEAMDSPWIKGDHPNMLIIFNGNITQDDVSRVKDMIKFKNFRIKINRKDKGRTIYIIIVSHN